MKTIYIYILWWFAFPFVAIFNASLREIIYKNPLGDLAAHQISTVTGVVLFGILFYFIFRKYKIESVKHTILVGLIWLGLTILFEFGFGHYIMGNSWQKLLHDYNLAEGRVWSLFLVWITTAPFVFYKFFLRLKS
jgi:apolipoprotein N-acyltransferase